MILIRNIMLIVIGLSSGFAVSGGVFAFITMIGIIPRIADRTETAEYILLFEDMVILGGLLGNSLYIYEWNVHLNIIGNIFFGFFSGIFVGCLAVALAEVLDVIPVFARRANLKMGISVLILALAIGKFAGSLYQLIINP